MTKLTTTAAERDALKQDMNDTAVQARATLDAWRDQFDWSWTADDRMVTTS